MSARHADQRLRMEMLRLRGELQRADAAQALDDIRASSRGLHDLVTAVFRLGRVSSGGVGWVAAVTSALRERPWLLGLAMFALRTARRHPVASVIAAAASFAAWRVLRPAAAKEPAPEQTATPDPGPD
jgi:ABC-type transporter Mla MlaB component